MSRTRLNQYLKKLGVIIFLAILAFIILTLITKMLVNNDNRNDALDKELVDKNTSIYQNSSLSNEEISNIDKYLTNFVKICNEKKYQEIYNNLSDSYKNRFSITINDIIEFCNREFDKHKLFNYQNLSVINNKVVYELKIYDDIMATGVYSFDDYKYNVLTIVITKALDGTYKISLNGYIDTIEYSSENNYGQYNIVVDKKDIYYEYETYKIRVKNESENECLYMFKNFTMDNVKLKAKYQLSENSFDCKTTLNPFISNLIIYPSSQKEFELKFSKYYDTTNMDLKNILVFEDVAFIPYYILEENKNIDNLQSIQLANTNTINIELNK